MPLSTTPERCIYQVMAMFNSRHYYFPGVGRIRATSPDEAVEMAKRSTKPEFKAARGTTAIMQWYDLTGTTCHERQVTI
jgi:hypothetical protein